MAEITRTVRVASSHGLHARPAKLFAQAAKESGVPVTIAKGEGAAVNAASILSVISLGIEHDDEVTLAVDVEDTAAGEATLETLAALITTDHDAE